MLPFSIKSDNSGVLMNIKMITSDLACFLSADLSILKSLNFLTIINAYKQ